MAVNPIMNARMPQDARSAGVSGIHAGLRGMDLAAQEIAEMNVRPRAGSPSPADGLDDAARALIDLQIYARNVQASVKVVKTADELLGFLLDQRA